MNYSRIYYKQGLCLQQLRERLNAIEVHLLLHPQDYQARVASVLLRSRVVDKEHLLKKINYLVKINYYK